MNVRPLRYPFVLAGALLAWSCSAPAAETQNNLQQLVAAAAAYESGQSMEPLRHIETLIRQSANDAASREKIEAGLLELLAGPSTMEAKQFAAQQLAVVGTEASLPVLGELLKNPDTVGLACTVLATHPSPKASEVMRGALPELRGAARLQVIRALGSRQDAGAVALLSELANHSDAAVASAAIAALGRIANQPAREVIATLLKTSRPELAPAVAEASLNAAERLARAGEEAAATAIYEALLDPTQAANVRRGALDALLRLEEDGGEQRIVRILQGTDPVLIPVAIAGIHALRSQSASERFAGILPSLQPQEQVWLVEILALRHDPAARAAVDASIRSENAAVRLAAIEAAGKHGDASLVPALAQALAQKPPPRERTTIERALISLSGGTETEQAIIKAAKTAPTAVKPSLFSVLARRGSHSAIPYLIEETQTPETAPAAFRALSDLARAEDAPLLLDKLINLEVPAARSDAESATAQALLKIEDRSRRSQLVSGALARAGDVEVQSSLIRLLPACGDAPALAALKAACDHPHPTVRDTAIRALADWPDAAAWDAMTAVYKQTENEAHRVLSLRALARLAEEENMRPDARLMDRYRVLLEAARRDEDRTLILGALAGAAHPDALKLALPYLSKPNVRAEAEMALKKIADSIKTEHPEAVEKALQRLADY
jgi:HEAT repeat protein